jgi:endonuclease/exonuclease/phosphatase (EEP) superfamily protein YafD
MKITTLLNRLFIAIVSIVVLLILFQPDIPYVMFISENAIWVIFALIFVAIVSMIYNNKSLLYFGMFSAALLTLYLKNLSNENLMFHVRDYNKSSLYVLHMNISNIEEDDKDKLIKKIEKSDPDIISCEEITPDWHEYLIKVLKNKYPNIISINQFNVDGKIVLSKYKFIEKDTFLLSGHPQLDVKIEFNDTPINLLFANVLPFSMIGENAGNKYQIEDLGEYIKKKDKKSMLIVGEFNQVYWSKSIRNFLYNTKLNNARRSVSFAVRNPYDHIFYSNNLKCVELDEIFDLNSEHIGIQGRFKVVGY